MDDYCHLVLAEKQELLWRIKVEGRVAMAIEMHSGEFLEREKHQNNDELFQV